MPQRAVDQLVRLPQLVGGSSCGAATSGKRRCRVGAGQIAEDERADHVVVRHARQVARGVQAGHGRAGVFVDPYAGRGMPLHKPISEMCISTSWVR